MASLGKDLATIREQKGKTLEDIHDSTKIPMHFLQAIEDGRIFTEFDENKTYIRSYIRSYGKALNIDESQVVEALDSFELGTYDGELLDKSGLEDTKRSKFTYDDEQAQDTHEESAEGHEENEAEEAPLSEPRPPSSSGQSAADVPRSSEQNTAPPSVSSVNWADMGRQFTPIENRSSIWIGAVVVFIIVVAVFGYWLYQNSAFDGIQSNGPTSNATQNITEPGIVPDSLQLNVSSSEQETVAVGVTSPALQNTTGYESLPDTLELLVYAAYNRLEPVRVYTNLMQDFNPYWIEQGQAYRFQFTDFVRIRGQYSRMELLVNGHPLENFRERFFTSITPDSHYVELQRSFFEEEETWLQPPPDSTELNFPPPDSIDNRPSFPIASPN